MRKLLIFVCGFAAAVGVLVYFLGGVFFWAFPVLTALTITLFFFRKPFLRRTAIFCLGLTMGLLWCSGYTMYALKPVETLCGETTQFRGRVMEYSTETRSGSALAAEIFLDGREIPVTLFISEPVAAKPGDSISGSAAFEKTPTVFAEDQDLYSVSRGIFLTGTADGELQVSDEEDMPLRAVLRRFARQLQENLYAVFPADAAGYFTSLTNGDRSGISYALKNRLSVVGLYHAVSLSGMHISILMSTLIILCMGRKRLAAILGIPTIILFCLLSGGNPATIRAVVMQILLLLCLFVDREYDPLTALSAALLFLLLQNPWSLTHWGLQLSFASSAGILILMPKFQQLSIKKKVVRIALTPVFVTISATVFSAPLLSIYFGLNSLVAPLTNLLALWAVTLSFVGGIVTSLLGFVFMPAAQILAQGCLFLYRWVFWVTDTFSRLPWAAVYAETPLLLAWSYLPYLLPVVCLYVRPKWYLAAGCLILSLTGAILLSPQTPDGMTVLDVGQGQCVLLRSENETVMVDCGGQGNVTGEDAARHLLSQGVTELDALVISHFDTDHCDGVLQFLDRISVKRVYMPVREKISGEQEEICRVTGEVVTYVTEPMAISLGKAEVSVYPAVGGKEENDTGLSVLATCQECDILITGDLDVSAEARLLTAYDLPDLEILVAGHHGASDSTGAALLDVLRPETVLISVGKNGFGHPAEETLNRIAATGAVVYTTQDNGNLTVGW